MRRALDYIPPETKDPTGGASAGSITAFPGGNEGEIRTLLDAVPQNLYLVIAEGTLIYLNRVALEYYGLPLEDFISGVAL